MEEDIGELVIAEEDIGGSGGRHRRVGGSGGRHRRVVVGMVVNFIEFLR